jgi:hypothetical protein
VDARRLLLLLLLLLAVGADELALALSTIAALLLPALLLQALSSRQLPRRCSAAGGARATQDSSVGRWWSSHDAATAWVH